MNTSQKAERPMSGSKADSRMSNEKQRLRILEELSRGELAVLADRTYSQSEGKKKMSKWLY